MNSIQESKETSYDFFSSNLESFNKDLPIISVIIDCYYGLHLIKKSVQSILDQTYKNVELVLVDNGAINEVSEYLNYLYKEYSNIALISFKENQFSWNDTEANVVVCWNAGLLRSGGEIITHLSYDDILSSDCCSKMAKLFLDNESCVTAAPLPVSININGKINQNLSKSLENGNRRPKYVSGKKLALDFITKSPKKYFSAPGGIFFIKKEILIKHGGFDRSSDITQIIKLAIHGDSAFDPSAKLLWRHHDNQANKLAKLDGVTWCNDLVDVVESEGIINTWKSLFSKDDVKALKLYVKKESLDNVKNITIELLRKKKTKALLKSLKNITFKCPSLIVFVVWSLLLEVFKIMIEKLFKKT